MRPLCGFELEPQVRDWFGSLSDNDYARADEVCACADISSEGSRLHSPALRAGAAVRRTDLAAASVVAKVTAAAQAMTARYAGAGTDGVHDPVIPRANALSVTRLMSVPVATAMSVTISDSHLASCRTCELAAPAQDRHDERVRGGYEREGDDQAHGQVLDVVVRLLLCGLPGLDPRAAEQLRARDAPDARDQCRAQVAGSGRGPHEDLVVERVIDVRGD
jgi:hypothetical protein